MISYYKQIEPYSSNSEVMFNLEIPANMRLGSELNPDKLGLWSEGKISTEGNLDLHPLQLCSFLFSDKIRLQILTISNGEGSSGEIFKIIREWDSHGYLKSNGEFRQPFDGSSGSFDSYSLINHLYDTRNIVVKLLRLGIVETSRRSIIEGLGRQRNVTLYRLNPDYVESTLAAALIVGVMKSVENLKPYSELIDEPRTDVLRNYNTLATLAGNEEGLTVQQIYRRTKVNAIPSDPIQLENELKSFQNSTIEKMIEKGFLTKKNNTLTYKLKPEFVEAEDLERHIVREGNGLIDLVLAELTRRFPNERMDINDLRIITDQIRDYEGLVFSGSHHVINKLLGRGIIIVEDGVIVNVKPGLRKNLPSLAQGSQANQLARLIQENIGSREFNYNEIDSLLDQVDGIKSDDGKIDIQRKKDLWWYFQSRVLDSFGKVNNRRINLYTITEKGQDCFGLWREVLADPIRFLSLIGNEDFSNLKKLGKIRVSGELGNELDMRYMPKVVKDIYEETFVEAASNNE